jgi:hypothetical protein
LGWLWLCPQTLKPDWKRFPRKNTKAYWTSSSVTKFLFIALTPGVNVIQPFFFITDDEVKLAQVFAPGKPFQTGKVNVDQARSLLLRGVPEKL